MAEAEQRRVNPQPGDVLAGKYRVERVLGSGGMGVVVAAHHLQLDERVALKFLLPNALVNPETVTRFVREARAAVKIKNEHVARVTDVGELENGAPYMVMEYLDGSDLSSWLQQHGALPVEQAVDFILQACEALAEAHSLGIVHRDLKPANLFCLQKPDGSFCIKVLDFGISKVLTPDGAPTGSEMTRTSAFLGSPLYMSPEQLQHSKGVDTRTDIWSLGIILFELVTGRAPFDANAVTELIIKIATTPAPPLRQFRGDAPPALEALLARCLEKDRGVRFQTVGELAVALQSFGSVRGRMSTEGILGTLGRAGMSPGLAALPRESRPSATSGSVPSQTNASWGGTSPPGVRSGGGRLLPVLVGVGAACVIGGVAAFVLHRTSSSTAVVVAPTPSATPSAPPIPPVAETAAAATPTPGVATPAPTPVAIAPPPPMQTSTHHAATPVSPPQAGVPPVSPPQAAVPPVSPPQAASAAPVTTPSASCDPPFTLDDQGRKHFKPECFLKK
jgi:serine/threonine protein kinase